MRAELDYFGTWANRPELSGGARGIRDPGDAGDLFAEKAGFWQKTQPLGVKEPALLCEHGQNRLHEKCMEANRWLPKVCSNPFIFH